MFKYIVKLFYSTMLYIMVYFGKNKQGKGHGPWGMEKISVGAGPIKITSKPSLRNQVLNVQKSVKEIQNKEELKYLDTYINGSALSSTPILTLLNGMIQQNGTGGNDQNERDGNQVNPTSIQFRLEWFTDVLAVGSGITFRHIIFWDAQSNGAAPSAGDLLDQSVIVNPCLAPYKREYQKRFKIVYDKVQAGNSNFATIQNTSGTPAAPTAAYLNCYYMKKKRSLNRIVKYRNAQNTGTITDIASNSLYSLLVTRGTNGGTLTVGYRMYFKDE